MNTIIIYSAIIGLILYLVVNVMIECIKEENLANKKQARYNKKVKEYIKIQHRLMRF
jgi:hypothetical protein